MKNIKFINAGAGSGKTYTLTSLLAENILNEKCNANEVIMTTFTEKAAAELKARASETLQKNDMPDQANLLSTAAIGTVHSVAYQLIRKYWYHVGSPVDMKVMSEEDVNFYLNQALANVPTGNELKQLREIAENLSFRYPMGSASVVNYDLWKDHLNSIFEYAIANNTEDLETSGTASLEEASFVFPRREAELNEHQIKAVLSNYRAALDMDPDDKTKPVRIKATEALLSTKDWKIPDFIEAGKVLNASVGRHRQTVPEIDTQLERLAHIFSSPVFVDAVMDYIRILFSIAQRSLNEFREYKLKNRLIDYNDMESMLLKILEKEEVQLEITATFKQVYVDEFQDSSPIQFSIFNKLSDLVEQSYWVGDPKQAIYGFRGTDPELIGAVVDTFAEEREDLTLDNLKRSWRSRPGIVNICNSIFSKALINQIKNVEHIRLEADVRSEDELPSDSLHASVQHWHLKDNKERGGNEALKWNHLAESIQQLLEKDVRVTRQEFCKYHHPDEEKENVIHTGKLRPGDIAVLCKTNEAVSVVTAELRNFGIKVAGKQKGIRETAEMQLLIAAINYLLDPGDQLARSVLLMLSGEFIEAKDLIDDRLEYLYADDAPVMPRSAADLEDEEKKQAYREWNEYLDNWRPDNEILKKISSLNGHTAILSVPVIIEKLIIEGGLYDLVRRWDNPEQRMANLQTMVSKASTYDERCLTLNIAPSYQGFIRYMDQLNEKNFMQSAATGEDAVNVLTYHSAKGLEWPFVVLTQLENQKADENQVARKAFFGVSNENPDTIVPEDPFRGKVIKLIPWPFGASNTSIPVDIENRIKETERFSKELVRELNESNRLLYVGFTRARDILVTTSYNTKQLKWLELATGNIDLKTGLNTLPEGETEIPVYNTQDMVLVRTMEFGEERIEGEPVEENLRVPEKGARQGSPGQKYVSPSGIEPVDDVLVTELKDFGQRVEIGKTTPDKEAALGNCLHDIYAAYDPGGDENAFLQLVKDTVRRHNMEGSLSHPEHIASAISKLFAYMETSYGKATKSYRELPLQSEKEGVVYRGEADLVWETEKGLVIVDYKSFPGGRDHVLRPGDNHYAGKYSGQLKKYREMVEAGHPKQKKVLDTLLYYSVSGLLVRVEGI